jgi:uncharacterized protein
MKRFSVRNRTRGSTVAANAPLANSYFSRLMGLMGRKPLPAGEGLIIEPCSSIHTCFMRFPIEVLFVDRAHRVLRATAAVQPWRFGPIVPQAHYVVELPAGAVAASNTQVGDVLEWEPAAARMA